MTKRIRNCIILSKMYGWYYTVKIHEMYANNKKAYRKNKDIVLLHTMREIDRLAKEANIDASFMKEYKNYKLSSVIYSSVLPSILFGFATGCVCIVIGNYMTEHGESQLFTIPTVIISSALLLGTIVIIVIYLVINRHTYTNILLPYTIKKMEEKIEAHITSTANQQYASKKYKVIVKRHRKTGKKEKTDNGTKST